MTAFHDTLATAIQSHAALALSVGGFAIGLLMGAVLQASNYCVMGAISDWRLASDKGRLGAAALAAAVAILGAQLLDASGVTDLSKSMYLSPRLNWFGAIAGGLIFGYGMVYAGGCPSRALTRAGGGDLRALISLLAMCVAALATLSGIFGSARVSLDTATAINLQSAGIATQSASDILSRAGLSPSAARWTAAAAIAGPLLSFAALQGRVFSMGRNLLGGLGVGAIVTLGWALTGLARDEMTVDPVVPASLSFVKPVSDAVDWLERATALGWPGFSASTVFGVLAGSFAACAMRGQLCFQGFADGADFRRHIFGASAMGVGGILGLGCTIGQGVTGISTLAIHSILAITAIVGGAVIALARLEKLA